MNTIIYNITIIFSRLLRSDCNTLQFKDRKIVVVNTIIYYKGTNSIGLMAVVDHDYCFIYVDIGSYGCNADGGVFQNCSLYLENNLLLPENGILFGDMLFL